MGNGIISNIYYFFSGHSDMKLTEIMHSIRQPCCCPKYISKGKVSLNVTFCLEVILQFTGHNEYRSNCCFFPDAIYKSKPRNIVR